MRLYNFLAMQGYATDVRGQRISDIMIVVGLKASIL